MIYISPEEIYAVEDDSNVEFNFTAHNVDKTDKINISNYDKITARINGTTLSKLFEKDVYFYKAIININEIPSNGDTITLGSNIYEFDNTGSYIGTNTVIDIQNLTTANEIEDKLIETFNNESPQIIEAYKNPITSIIYLENKSDELFQLEINTSLPDIISIGEQFGENGELILKFTETDLSDPGNYVIEFIFEDTIKNIKETVYRYTKFKIKPKQTELQLLPEETTEEEEYTSVYYELINYVRIKLNEPLESIELTDEMIHTNIQDAIEEYLDKAGGELGAEKIYKFDINSQGVNNGFDIPDYVLKTMYQVVLNRLSLTTGLVPEYTVQDYFYAPLIEGYEKGLADIYILNSFENNFDKIMGTKPTWEIIDGKLFIWPTIEKYSGSILLRYKDIPDIDTIKNNRWIKKYAVALNKLQLGEIRSKYPNGFPAGEITINLNGNELKSEAQQEIERLEQELYQKLEPFFIEKI